jgi:hypothetical protein
MSGDILRAVAIYLAWVVGFLFMVQLAGDAPSHFVYGIIFGWGLAFYASARLRPTPLSIVLLAAGFATTFLVALMAGSRFFYRDASALSIAKTAEIAIGQTLFFCSPAIIDFVVSRAIDRWRKPTDQK